MEAVEDKAELWREVKSISISQVFRGLVEEAIFNLNLAAIVFDDAADAVVGETIQVFAAFCLKSIHS